MIVKIPYSEVKATGLKGFVGGKKANFFMHVTVTDSELAEAVEKLDRYKNVIALEYTGSAERIKNVEFKSKPVLVMRYTEDLDLNFGFLMNQFPHHVRVIAELPQTFTDMRQLMDANQKYPNARFVGGKFLAIEGARLGIHPREDIPKKIPDSRIPLVTEGVVSCMRFVDFTEVEEPEYYDAHKEVVKKERKVAVPKATEGKKKAKPKKQLTSLFDLTGSGFSNF